MIGLLPLYNSLLLNFMNFISLRPAFLALIMLASSTFANAADNSRVYELRTYTTLPGKLDSLLARFRDHTTQLFEKHGMTNIGYFVPLDAGDGSADKLVYILSYPSRPAAVAAWNAFRDDPEWKRVRDASETNGKIVAKVDSVYLVAADFSPPVVQAKSAAQRTFELRTYTTPEGGLEAIDARFRDHTTALLDKHGITNLYYWHPLDADKGAGRTLIYLLAHQSRDAAKASWDAFRDDPAWTAVKSASEKKMNGSLTSDIKSVFLAPTDFSKLK